MTNLLRLDPIPFNYNRFSVWKTSPGYNNTAGVFTAGGDHDCDIISRHRGGRWLKRQQSRGGWVGKGTGA